MRTVLCIASAVGGLWLSSAGINPPYIYWQTVGTFPFFVWNALEAALALVLLIVSVRLLKLPKFVTMASVLTSGVALLSVAEFCFWNVVSDDPYPVLLRQMVGAWTAPPFLLMSAFTIDWRHAASAIRWPVMDAMRSAGTALAVAAASALAVLLFRNIHRPLYAALDTIMFAVAVAGISAALALAFRVFGRTDP
jgi:hypothetical protein